MIFYVNYKEGLLLPPIFDKLRRQGIAQDFGYEGDISQQKGIQERKQNGTPKWQMQQRCTSGFKLLKIIYFRMRLGHASD